MNGSEKEEVLLIVRTALSNAEDNLARAAMEFRGNPHMMDIVGCYEERVTTLRKCVSWVESVAI